MAYVSYLQEPLLSSWHYTYKGSENWLVFCLWKPLHVIQTRAQRTDLYSACENLYMLYRQGLRELTCILLVKTSACYTDRGSENWLVFCLWKPLHVIQTGAQRTDLYSACENLYMLYRQGLRELTCILLVKTSTCYTDKGSENWLVFCLQKPLHVIQTRAQRTDLYSACKNLYMLYRQGLRELTCILLAKTSTCYTDRGSENWLVFCLQKPLHVIQTRAQRPLSSLYPKIFEILNV